MLSMNKSVYRELRSHGEETYPHECCGVLIGSSEVEGWAVVRAVRANNVRTDSPQDRYAIEPLELVKILREARSLNLEIAGFYHSHPDHPAMWSQTDLAEAHWLGCSYLITEVADGHAVVTNSFLLSGISEEDKQFIPQRIELLG
ncbi:M67 family metallopeptidase [Telmatobacter sp. DSM 110680]|uniref:M67 family metallopeptidase n=2 Tax=Telmatobacter sp. DSM 110680 TaxID=3036704 RepID=A0AAU7DT18_9BACT